MHDVVIRNGTIYDGSGKSPYVSDIAIKSQCVAKIANSIREATNLEIDATGLAVAPGFINMLSWANESLIADGRSQSDIRQGVTLEVMGEGNSMGPWNDALKKDRLARQGDIKYEISWTKLSEYLSFLAKRGISTNVASFVGATTIRRNVIGDEDRAPNKTELNRMQDLVKEAMREGAVGVSSALIYAPAFYAKTDELIALAKTSAEHGGMYASHLRSEGNTFLEALDEFLHIAREANTRAEVYHLKAAGQRNWKKMNQAIKKIEEARHAGQEITASMYMYTAAATGFDASMPPWVQEGGEKAWIERLKDPAVRAKLKHEMTTDSKDWENGLVHAGAEGIILSEFKNEKLKPLTGKTLAEVAKLLETSPEEAIMDLIVEDNSQIGVIYFWMCEENLRKQIALPWVSLCSDASSLAPEGVFLKSSKHPRAYGNVARFLGKYVREEKVIELADAIRRLTGLPATNLKIDRRGFLKPGYFADIVIFDPDKISDHSTFENPHQYSTGVKHVLVNGTQVLKDGEHTGKFPGQVVYGPGQHRLPGT